MLYFCPNCHKQIIPPSYLSNIKTQSGTIKIKCGECNKGEVEVKVLNDNKKDND